MDGLAAGVAESVAAPVAAVTAFFFLAAAPGPATLSVAAAAMARGRGAATALSFGLAAGLAAWGAVAAAGFGALLAASAPALWTLKLAGAAVLFWLAFVAARSALSAGPSDLGAGSEAEARRSALGWALRGAALNGLNPKALAAWGAVVMLGAGGTGGGAGASPWAIWTVCSILGLAIYLGYARLFSLGPARRVFARVRRGAEALVAAVFGLAALRLLTWRAEAP